MMLMMMVVMMVMMLMMLLMMMVMMITTVVETTIRIGCAALATGARASWRHRGCITAAGVGRACDC